MIDTHAHMNEIHKRTHQIVSEKGIEKAVFHWYTGSLDVLGHIIEDGYFISASPALAYSPPHQAAMKYATLKQILIETDSPVEYQGKVSEPADLLVTLREVSHLKDIELDEVSRITTANAERFLGI